MPNWFTPEEEAAENMESPPDNRFSETLPKGNSHLEVLWYVDVCERNSVYHFQSAETAFAFMRQERAAGNHVKWWTNRWYDLTTKPKEE